MTSPLLETIERVRAALPYVGVAYHPVGDALPSAAAVVNDPQAVEAMLEQVRGLYRMGDRQIAASFLVLSYFWNLAVGSCACFLLDRRVPDLSSDVVSVDLQQGVVFHSGRFWVLPDDPAADHPDADVVDDLDSLRAFLIRPMVTQHAEPLFATLRSVAPYGIPAMRANFTDRLASVILWLAEELGTPDVARQEVPAVVELANPKSRSGYVAIEHEGRCKLFLHRGGCCLNYRLPGAEKCDTCSLRPVDERLTMLREHLIAEAVASS